LQVPQVADPDAAPAVLVFVGRTDPPPRGADLFALLARPVEELVKGQREVSPLGDVDPMLRLHPLGLEGVQLREERLGVERHAVPDQADRALEDPRGDLVQHELAGAAVHGVARIGPALVAHDEVGALGEHVHELAFAFVAPLRADHDHAVGFRSEHELLGRAGQKKCPDGAGRWTIL